MEVNDAIFLRLLVGAFGFAILGFLVRGLSQFAVDPDTAELISTPVFVLAFGMAVLAFLLAVLVKLDFVSLPPDHN